MSNELKITTKISCNRFGLVIRLFKCHPKNAQQSVNQLVKLTESSDKLKMISACVSRLVILAFGWLYPAYNSYKAVRTKNVKEYVRWMMHWIVFAIFSSIELFTDTFISWFPFYYEVKVSIVFWLLSPVTKGSSIIYKKFIHPKLSRHEQEIDEYLNQAKEKGYTAVLQLGTKGFDYASKLIVETAIKGAQTIKRSYSLSDLSETDGDVVDGRHQPFKEQAPIRHRASLRIKNVATRSSSLTKRPISEIYFPEVELKDGGGHVAATDYSYMRSVEDISSGYSSQVELSRTSSLSNASLARSRPKSKDTMSVSSTLPRRRTSEKAKMQRATK